ncbi:breast cancer type 2 susceptibility protein homolog isoform X2 [Calliopsis andreniformis]|uniref:breast cancer type 2 susceptibility protein homolog isoform X2 n=1 Tax=Calliopsis andreniformis TaxID=337506 RepID=UPI003FCCFAEC
MNVNENDETFGFMTASGRAINVSDEALSKAKQLYAEVVKETDNCEETNKKQGNESAVQVSSSRFRTINNKQSKNNASFETKDFDKKSTSSLKSGVPSFGFKTASGRSINVSDEALSRAEQLFKNDLENEITVPDACATSGSQIIGSRYLSKAKPKLQKKKVCLKEPVKSTENRFSVGFKTAGGNSITVSDEALSQAMQQFEDANDLHLETFNQTLQEVEMLLPEESLGQANNTIVSVGFKTASGNTINISEKALLNAENLFKNLEDTDASEEVPVIEKSINKSRMQVESLGFQTAGGQSLTITEEALSKAKALFSEETLEDVENNFVSTKSLQKRKVKDLDDDASSNKGVTSNQFKKLRFSSEFEIKNNNTQSKNIEKNKNQVVSCGTTKVLVPSNDIVKLDSNIDKATTSKKDNDLGESFLISHEIVESTAALLADENKCEQCISPVANIEAEEAENVPSSPVIGQFIPKKRKSIGNRRKSVSSSKKKEDKSVSTDDLKELNDKNVNKCIKKQSENLVVKQEFTNIETCETSVINEFGDSQLMLDFINETANILEKRLEATLEQDKQISLKKKYKPRPTISKLYFHRKANRNNRVSWKQISKGHSPTLCTYKELVERKLPPEILDITADNAIRHKFRCTDFYRQDMVQSNIEGIKLEDEGWLILDENGYVGISEMKRSFLASPGVDPHLLPSGWVENHYKWIVWKLASMDRVKFGSITLPRSLSPARVMMELKYRYDREIDRTERPALRKILEKDDVASKRMVLCVSSISECDDSANANRSPNQLKAFSKKVILTDGWYSVQASIDQAMITNILSSKVREGTKLITYGSELLNCDEGCPPLEVPQNVCLKIHTNSTRRVKWDTKLGYVAPIGPICVKLKSICPNGGLIGKIKVSIARVYPILYHEKTPDGESVFRNARCEEKANDIYEKECRSIIEAFYAKAEKYFSAETKKSNSNPDSIDLAAIEWNEDCEKLSKEELRSQKEQEQLVNDCRKKEEIFRQKLESRLQKSLPPSRQVTPILKVRVVEEETNAILSIWSPSEEIRDILKEGNFISICNLMASGKRGNEMQLTANRNAIFNQLNISNATYPARTYTPLCDISKPTFAPAYGEFDTGMKNFQAAYLAYPHTESQSSYLSVLFWHGISSHGYAEILTEGSFIACSNLEWRRVTPWNIPMAYCTDRSTFTRNPRQSHLQQPFEDLKRLITDTGAYVTTCAAEIAEEVQKKSTTRMSDQYTPNKTSFHERFSSNKSFGNSTSQEVSRNLLSNQTTARSSAIQKRIERLQHYGEPPRLSPIVLRNSSKRVSLDFQSPYRSSGTQQTKARVSLSQQYSQNPS